MVKVVILASLAASGLFAACRHHAPTPQQPAPRELPPMGPRPTPVEPVPVPPIGVPSSSEPHSAPAVTIDAGVPGPTAMVEPPQRMREDSDSIIGEDDETPRPASIKPDGGILYDGGAPLPPVPDAGPMPGPHDARQPMKLMNQ